MSRLRHDMQIIFQDPYAGLDKKMKIGQIVAEGIEKHKISYGNDALKIAVELSTGKDLFENPMHPYTKMLLESIPVSHPKLRKQRLNLEEAEISLKERKTGCKFCNRCSYAKERCRYEIPVIKEIGSGHFLSCHLYD